LAWLAKPPVGELLVLVIMLPGVDGTTKGPPLGATQLASLSEAAAPNSDGDHVSAASGGFLSVEPVLPSGLP
jgi:hypothetical protein